MENLKKQLPKLQRTIQFMDSDLFKKCEIKVEGGGTNENGELVFVEFEINIWFELGFATIDEILESFQKIKNTFEKILPRIGFDKNGNFGPAYDESIKFGGTLFIKTIGQSFKLGNTLQVTLEVVWGDEDNVKSYIQI